MFNEATVRVPYVSGVSQARVHLFHPDGKILSDVWDISRASTSQPDQFQYPTQKVPALLERIVGALSPRSGTVLDPCCGSGTTLVVSEQSGRNWIGVDRSPKAIEITRKRILEALDAGIPSLSLEDMSSDS